MHTDVAHAAGDAGATRIEAPHCLRAFQWRRQPALDVFDDDLAHGAECAVCDEFACLLDHGVARVRMCESIEQAGLVQQRGEFAALFQVEGRGLIRQHMEALLQCSGSRTVMLIVRRDDDDALHALAGWQRGFAQHHRFVIGIAARLRKTECRAGLQ
jgi:hypothetical protein